MRFKKKRKYVQFTLAINSRLPIGKPGTFAVSKAVIGVDGSPIEDVACYPGAHTFINSSVKSCQGINRFLSHFVYIANRILMPVLGEAMSKTSDQLYSQSSVYIPH